MARGACITSIFDLVSRIDLKQSKDNIWESHIRVGSIVSWTPYLKTRLSLMWRKYRRSDGNFRYAAC